MQAENKKGFFSCVIRGALVALITALLGVLIFSFIIKIASLNSGIIKTVNQFIKVLAVFLGCIISLDDRMGLVKGSVIGALSSVLIYLVFSMFFGQVEFGISFVFDVIFSAVIGGIAGIISVNLKKR